MHQRIHVDQRRMFDIMGGGGVYVLAALQPNVPADNALAMFEAGRCCIYGG